MTAPEAAQTHYLTDLTIATLYEDRFMMFQDKDGTEVEAIRTAIGESLQALGTSSGESSERKKGPYVKLGSKAPPPPRPSRGRRAARTYGWRAPCIPLGHSSLSEHSASNHQPRRCTFL